MGILSRTGIISANYKKSDKNDIEYYRPISLLNQDYKIYTTILENTMLSMFNIVTEVLANFIIVDTRTKGMQIGNQEIKIVNFADDATIFLGDINCLNRIRTILNYLKKHLAQRLVFQKAKPYGLMNIKTESINQEIWNGHFFSLKYSNLYQSITFFAYSFLHSASFEHSFST